MFKSFERLPDVFVFDLIFDKEVRLGLVLRILAIGGALMQINACFA
jgi:hypothetical protein